MARLLAMYKTPKDAAAFDDYYFRTHVPLAKTIPGLRRYEVNRSPVVTPAGPAGYHLIAILHFDDMAAIQAAFTSAQGQATVADTANFATGGVDILFFEQSEV
jgi:uncharacterized protein (TIGR02118 family)